jgi:hypothetical protein
MIKKTLFILLSLPVFLTSCPENEGSKTEITIHEKTKKQETQVGEENTLPLKSSPRPQVILTPLKEDSD